MAQVIAVIHIVDDNYGISFPDFPGVASGGKTPDEVLARGRDTLRFHIEGMVEDGDKLPMLRSLEQLRKDPVFAESPRDAIFAWVELDMPSRPTRVNISIDENLLRAVDRAAEMAGQNRSAYLSDAARLRMRGTG